MENIVILIGVGVAILYYAIVFFLVVRYNKKVKKSTGYKLAAVSFLVIIIGMKIEGEDLRLADTATWFILWVASDILEKLEEK